MEACLNQFEQWAAKAAPADRPLRVTIVGAGNLCHVMAGTFGARPDTQVSVFTRRAAEIAENMTAVGVKVTVQSLAKGIPDTELLGKCKAVSADPAEVIPDADLIIITTPSHARKWVMQQITPHLPSDRLVFVGVMPGMGGFDWIADEILAQAGRRRNVVVWGLKDVPYMSAWTTPGVSATNLGPKKDLYLALGHPRERELPAVVAVAEEEEKQAVAPVDEVRAMNVLADILKELTDIPVVKLSSFMVITLTPGNPIMHPSIMYGMFGPHSQWDGKPLPEQPLFYEGVSELSSYFLTRADTEVQLIKNAIIGATGVDLEAVWPLRLNLKKVYGERVGDNRTLMLAMQTNRAYETIRTPLKKVDGGFVPNIEHRFFLEDVPFGLVVLRDLADMMQLEVPMISELIEWSQELMGKEYLVQGRLQGKDLRETGAAKVYGVLRIQDLVPEQFVAKEE